MADRRNIMIIFAIAVLFAIFVFAIIDAVYPNPQYNNFCKNDEKYYASVQGTNCSAIGLESKDEAACEAKNGTIKYVYDSTGCAKSYECDTCSNEFQQATAKYDNYLFYISAVLSLIAIFLGLYLPAQINTLNESIGSGFMLGGIFALFFGTIKSFNSLGRFTRPIVILLELVLIIYIAYKKIGNLRK